MTDIASPTNPSAAIARAMLSQRTNMVDSQVRPSDITDRRIIRAMGAVPREVFVPAGLKAIAYMDNALTLARTPVPRALMEPRLFAKLVQLAEIPDGGRVLEVGCGTGYGVAVLTAMGCKATGVEENAELAAEAQKALAAVGGTQPPIRIAALTKGAPDDGPFDAIILSGSVAQVPAALFDQLKAGGRLVAVVGAGPSGKATVWLRSGTTFDPRDAFDAGAAPLPGFARSAQFVF